MNINSKQDEKYAYNIQALSSIVYDFFLPALASLGKIPIPLFLTCLLQNAMCTVPAY